MSGALCQEGRRLQGRLTVCATCNQRCPGFRGVPGGGQLMVSLNVTLRKHLEWPWAERWPKRGPTDHFMDVASVRTGD